MLPDENGRRPIAAYDCARNIHLQANLYAGLHPVRSTVVKTTIEMWIGHRVGVERAAGVKAIGKNRPGQPVRPPDHPPFAPIIEGGAQLWSRQSRSRSPCPVE